MSNEEKKNETGEQALDQMSEGVRNDVFSMAFFAALTGIASRSAGQDPGMVANEAHTLAERALERLTVGKPVMTESERDAARREAAAAVLDGSAKVVASGNATIMGGRFPRPSASTP